MKKSQRIQTIVDLKESQEKNALEDLGTTQRKQQEQRLKLKNLKKYRAEYQQQYRQINDTAVSVKRLLDFRAFISKLDRAIEDQLHALQEAEKELSYKRKIWESAHHRTNSLKKIHATSRTEENLQQEKIEQKEQDDLAASSNARKI